jgi:hypothetical protein
MLGIWTLGFHWRPPAVSLPFGQLTVSDILRTSDRCAINEKGPYMPTQMVVHNPMGYPPEVSGKALAPRLDTLNGRTVYLVDCRFDDSDILLKSVQAWFAEHMPAVKTVYKPISSVYTRDDPATWQEIREKGDAAIIGVGH